MLEYLKSATRPSATLYLRRCKIDDTNFMQMSEPYTRSKQLDAVTWGPAKVYLQILEFLFGFLPVFGNISRFPNTKRISENFSQHFEFW